MKAFSLTNAPHLPVTGESHPLVKESVRRLATANGVTLLGALILVAGLYAWSQMQPEEPPVVEIPVVIEIQDPPVPRPIVDEPTADVGPELAAVPPELFEPEPAPDERAEGEFPSLDDLRKLWDGQGEYEGVVEITPPSEEPDAVFMPFDKLPVLLSIDAPVYPDLAKAAGIDGTVLVKIFVTRQGKVKQAVAVDGPEVLWQAAVDAAKTALFTPALQGDNPVDVWVTIPVTFSLNR
jgi:protein TonB